MLSFVPELKLENETKNLQGQLAELHQALEGLAAEEARYLHRLAFISNIGASTRIENAVLTDSEVDWVDTTLSRDGRPMAFEHQKTYILDKLAKDRERSVEEVVGCRQVLQTVYMQAEELYPLSETIIRGLHHDMLRFHQQAGHYAGRYKQAPNRVLYVNHATGEERTVLDPAPPGIITETAMADLVEWYNRAIRRHPWPLLVATELVFRFLAIHPFQDGNGRLGRVLFILALLQSGDKYWGKVSPFLAVDRHIEQHRALYYTTLQRAAGGQYHADPRKYDYPPLCWFFLKIVKESLVDIDFYRRRYARHIQLSESALAVLEAFKDRPEKRIKAAEIVNRTELPRRTVQYALRSLTEAGFIQRLGRGAATRYQLVF